MQKCTLLLFISLFVLNNLVLAHSIQFDITKDAPVVSINAYYSRTSPVANAGINIYAPGEKQPYQRGRTDKQGYFAFLPSSEGDWIFEIDDQHGHRDKVTISIDEVFMKGEPKVEESPKEKTKESPAIPVEPDKTKGASGIPTIYKLLIGLALIFGITGIYYGLRARQSLKKRD